MSWPWIQLPLWPPGLFQAWGPPPDPWWTSEPWGGTSFPGWRDKERFHASICPAEPPSQSSTHACPHSSTHPLIQPHSHSAAHWNIPPCWASIYPHNHLFLWGTIDQTWQVHRHKICISRFYKNIILSRTFHIPLFFHQYLPPSVSLYLHCVPSWQLCL